jgi:hypothetical protein
MPRRSPRFGDVWTIKGEVMGPELWLIVSNDLYLELSEDTMLAVPIRDTSRPEPGSSVKTRSPNFTPTATVRSADGSAT